MLWQQEKKKKKKGFSMSPSLSLQFPFQKHLTSSCDLSGTSWTTSQYFFVRLTVLYHCHWYQAMLESKYCGSRTTDETTHPRNHHFKSSLLQLVQDHRMKIKTNQLPLSSDNPLINELHLLPGHSGTVMFRAGGFLSWVLINV